MTDMNENMEAVETQTPEETVETVEGTVEDTAKEETSVEEENAQETEENVETEEESAENNSEDAEEDSSEEAEGKHRLFGKKKKEKVDKKDQQIEELTDRLKRTMAEFDNFRKRTEKEKASMYIIGAKDIVEKMLPVVDNFERGLAQAAEGDPFADGMRLTYKAMMDTLEGLGVKQIEALGQEFDPNYHNAVMHEENDEVGENIITEEFQKGYTYKDFVVRHSMVKVAN
ncbi:MAG: nucleotide exchange factor GrpE [Eubacteriales bacterium]|nr:nucleotide exchange factor GrpE [Eubacteriales bacterium]